MNIYEIAINEHFDIFDNYTLEVVTSLNEAEQQSAITSLCDRLYHKLIDEKFENIDFGDIEKSKGDITSYSGYQSTLDSLDIISGLIKEFKGSQDSVNIVYKAIQNIEENKNLFMKGYMHNIEFPMVFYNTMVLSVVSATSLLISTCVEMIKSPNSNNFELELDKISLSKSKDHVLLKNLDGFNKSCDKGDIQKSFTYIISMYSKEKGLVGSTAALGILSGAALIAILRNIIPIMRECIFFFFYTRTKISDYFEVQAELLQANAYRVQSNTSIEPEKRKEISRKQQDIANKFAKISNFVAVQMKSADTKAEAESKKEASIKFKADDIIDSAPANLSKDQEDSNTNSLF